MNDTISVQANRNLRTEGVGYLHQVGGAGPSDPSEQFADRLSRLEREHSLLRRQLALVQDQQAETEARLARLAPILSAVSLFKSAVRLVMGVGMLPVRAMMTITTLPAAAECLKQAKLRSHRLVKKADEQGWTSKLNRRAYFRHVRRAIGLSNPTIYRVTERQRRSIIRRPRVLHVIPNVWLGGSTQLILDLHNYLGHRFDMEVITSALPAQGKHQGMKISVIPKPPSRTAIRRIFAKFDPHIVHVHYWGDVDEFWYRPFFEIAAEFGYPVLQNINTPVAPFTSESVARNVFVSQTILDQFGSAAPAQVIYPGIDLSMFSRKGSCDPDAYDAIGMVYRLERDKLSESSIEPFIAVVKRRPQTRAIIVGDGSLFRHFRMRVQAEGLLDRFEFTGYVPYDELPALYARFMTFVAPVRQESFGQVIPFAMNMGLAVAGHRVGAIPEILGDTSTLGTTVDETASHIVRLLNNRYAIDALGARNRSIARAKYDVERMAIAYAGVYKMLAPEEVDLMPDYPSAVFFPV
jgi:glycosyltransferase involved in cell wall biosynthesis